MADAHDGAEFLQHEKDHVAQAFSLCLDPPETSATDTSRACHANPAADRAILISQILGSAYHRS